VSKIRAFFGILKGDFDKKLDTVLKFVIMTDGQKQALIFVREAGIIDNLTFRQMVDCDTLKASAELRTLKSHNLLNTKVKAKGIYYVAGPELVTRLVEISTPALEIRTPENKNIISRAEEWTHYKKPERALCNELIATRYRYQ
jgi:hypothetical protein